MTGQRSRSVGEVRPRRKRSGGKDSTAKTLAGLTKLIRLHLETDQRIRSKGKGDGTSAASRLCAISTQPIRGMLLRASNVYRPPR